MENEAKVLVLTLYSGENELDDAIVALKNQTYTNWEHKIFSYLPNVEAHQTLYEFIMKHTSIYDIFIKLDADMVLNRNTALSDIVNEFQKNDELDHAVFSVHDWASDHAIMGLHAYSRRVKWPKNNEKLFVDSRPQIRGHKKDFWKSPGPIAEHMPNPSIKQAYLFGYHRALKVVQPDRLCKNVGQARQQWQLLKNVWTIYHNTRDKTRASVLYGANQVFSKQNILIFNKYNNSDSVQNNITTTTSDNLYHNLQKCWYSRSIFFLFRQLRYVIIPLLIRFCIRLPHKFKQFRLLKKYFN